jgi:hypothetical protein
MFDRPIARALVGAAALCLSLGLAACGPEPEPTVATAEVPPPPKMKAPPKPKCESMDEDCKATPDTQAKIAGTELVFIPPEGWNYAQESEHTVTKSKASVGAMAMGSFDSGADESKIRDATYGKLAESIGVTLPERFKKKFVPNWNKADDSKKTGDIEIKLWQADEAKRDGKSGYLLVLLAADPGGKRVMGIAFAPKDDDKAVEAISKSLETLGPGGYQ